MSNRDDDFTNREITAMFASIQQTLNRIEGQTIKTNGRVTKLEVKTEGIATKIGVYATLAAAVVTAVINRLI